MFNTPEPEMLVAPIIPKGALIGLTSFPGTGKTWFAMDLSKSVATGGLFLNHYRANMGNVVFVGQDASIQDYGRQLRKLIREEYAVMERDIASGVRLTNSFDDRMHFIVDPGVYLERSDTVKKLTETILSIEHSEHSEIRHIRGEDEYFEEVTVKKGADLIVLDTLSSMVRCDQNNNTFMEYAFRNVRDLAKATGAGVLLLHHNPHPNEFNDGEGWRGASSQIAALDVWFHLHPIPHHPERLGIKIKRFRGLRPEDFKYTLTVDEERASLRWFQPDREQVIPPLDINMTDRVANWLLNNEGFHTIVAIRDALLPELRELGRTEATVYNDCRAALTNEVLFERGPGRAGYRLRVHAEA